MPPRLAKSPDDKVCVLILLSFYGCYSTAPPAPCEYNGLSSSAGWPSSALLCHLCLPSKNIAPAATISHFLDCAPDAVTSTWRLASLPACQEMSAAFTRLRQPECSSCCHTCQCAIWLSSQSVHSSPSVESSSTIPIASHLGFSSAFAKSASFWNWGTGRLLAIQVCHSTCSSGTTSCRSSIFLSFGLAL